MRGTDNKFWLHALFLLYMLDQEPSDINHISIKMRHLLFGLIALALLAAPATCYARETKDQRKERHAYERDTRKYLNEKASKVARKEAKGLEKDHWQVAPGALPLEKQLDRKYIMEDEYDDYGYPKYIIAEAMSVGGNYDAAKMQALALAKQNLAGLIETEIVGLGKNKVSNTQLNGGNATSKTESETVTDTKIEQNLGRVIPVLEAYRIVNGHNYEVRVVIAYSTELAQAITNRIIEQEQNQELDSLENKLDGIVNW